MSLFITNGLIQGEKQSFLWFIRIDDGKISAMGSIDELPSLNGHQVIRLTDEYQVIPGMIDVHIHGVDGADVMDGTIEALTTMAERLPQEGTTSFLATTITQAEDKIEQALTNTANYINQQEKGKARCLGIHLEGPFISTERAGAQPKEYILPPNVQQFAKWQQLAQGKIRIITMAPEEDHGLELIQYLKKSGVVVSIGHSNATYQLVDQAIQYGASHVTHLFNGMTGIHHRDPGVAGAALLRDELMVELIADGVHVSAEMIQLVYDQVTSERLILITDSMRAKCLKNGSYDFGGQQVTVANSQARLADGTLAGSILKMNDAFKNMHLFTNGSIEQLIHTTSLNAAKQLGIDGQKGSIAVGKDADLVILNQALNVEFTICEGIIAYERGIQDGDHESKRL